MDSKGSSGDGVNAIGQQWADWFKEHKSQGAQNAAQNITSTAWLKTIQQLKMNLNQVYEVVNDAVGSTASDPQQLKDLEERLAQLERKVSELTNRD